MVRKTTNNLRNNVRDRYIIASMSRAPETPLRDPPLSEPRTPDFQVTTPPDFQTTVYPMPDHSPAASATQLLRTPVVTTSTQLETSVPPPISTRPRVPLPVSLPSIVSSPIAVAYPDSSQAPVIQTLPSYTSYGSLFSRNPFPFLEDMPLTYLIHSLVHVLEWSNSLLRGMLLANPLPPHLIPFDQLGRANFMRTPLWPGNQYTVDSDLDELLASLLPLYAELLSCGGYSY